MTIPRGGMYEGEVMEQEDEDMAEKKKVEKVEAEQLPAKVEDQPVATHDSFLLSPEQFQQRIDEESAKRDMLLKYLRERLIPGIDYGLVHRKVKTDGGSWRNCRHKNDSIIKHEGKVITLCPDCGTKASLFKPGSEKICGLMQVKPEFQLDEEVLKTFPNGGVIPLICKLVHIGSGAIVAEGRGASNQTDDANKDIKMAEKRAQIDATLRMAGLSELLTQDIEDMKGFQKPKVDEDASSETKESGNESSVVQEPNEAADKDKRAAFEHVLRQVLRAEEIASTEHATKLVLEAGYKSLEELKTDLKAGGLSVKAAWKIGYVMKEKLDNV